MLQRTRLERRGSMGTTYTAARRHIASNPSHKGSYLCEPREDRVLGRHSQSQGLLLAGMSTTVAIVYWSMEGDCHLLPCEGCVGRSRRIFSILAFCNRSSTIATSSTGMRRLAALIMQSHSTHCPPFVSSMYMPSRSTFSSDWLNAPLGVFRAFEVPGLPLRHHLGTPVVQLGRDAVEMRIPAGTDPIPLSNS